MPRRTSAARKESTTAAASSVRQAFMMVAFSRSNSPTRPISFESETPSPATSELKISAARTSMPALTGENTEVMATAFRPFSRMSRPTSRSSFSSNGEISRPSNSWPPRTI